MKLQLGKPERMLLLLLRYSLYGISHEDAIFDHATLEDWNECYRIAKSQGVMAVAWDGVVCLDQNRQPHPDLKINWALAVERCEQRYLRYCETIDELSAAFSSVGITALQVKGVGLSAYYPVPSHRENGDIDIFAFYPDLRDDAHVRAYHDINKLMEQNGIPVDTTTSGKHSIFYYGGIPVENHKFLLDYEFVAHPFPLEDFLLENLHPQQVVLDGRYHVQIPSDGFNALFVARHAAQHYGSGLCLHHLYDWACLLKSRGLQIPHGMTDKRLLRFVYAITLLTDEIFGTAYQVQDERQLADDIIRDILRKPMHLFKMPQNRFAILVFKCRRMFYLHHFSKRVFGESLWKYLCFTFKFHTRNPRLIFGYE